MLLVEIQRMLRAHHQRQDQRANLGFSVEMNYSHLILIISYLADDGILYMVAVDRVIRSVEMIVFFSIVFSAISNL